MAISALTSIKYILSMFGVTAEDDLSGADKILAISVVWLIIAINCFSIKLNQELTKGLGYIKIFSLTMVVAIGVYGLATGVSNFDIFKYPNRYSPLWKVILRIQFLQHI